MSTGDAIDAGERDGSSYQGPRPSVGGSAGRRPDGGGSSSGMSVAEGAQLGELDESELSALCADVREIFEAQVSTAELDALSCTFGALSVIDLDRTASVVTVNRAQCQAHVADCLSFASGSSRLHCQSASFRAASTDCDATAEEYRSCMTVGAAALASAIDALTCENLSDPNEAVLAFQSAAQVDPLAHSECASLATRCPGLFGSASRGAPAADGCDETCRYSDDGFCDDGGGESQSSTCPLGTDCLDCGLR